MPYVPPAVCFKCCEPMRVIEIGIVAQMFAHDRSYYKISGDLLQCPTCETKILARFGNPMENFSVNYKMISASLNVQLNRQPKPSPRETKIDSIEIVSAERPE